MNKLYILLVSILMPAWMFAQGKITVGEMMNISKKYFVKSPSKQRIKGNQTKIAYLPVAMKVAGLASTQRPVGLSRTDEITNDKMLIGTAGTYPVAAIVDKQLLATYAGCKIVGIRFAVGSSIGASRVFLKQVSDNDGYVDIYEQNVRRTYEGWNNIFFNGTNTYQIKGDETLLFGYDYTETADMVTNKTGALAVTGTANDNGFFVYGNFGQGDGWYTVSQAGLLCAQLIVDVSTLPVNDIKISSLFIGSKYKKHGEVIDFFTSFNNSGLDSIRSYRMGYQIDGAAPVYKELKDTVAEGAVGSFEEYVAVGKEMAVGAHTLSVFCDKINGETVDREKNKFTERFYVYANGMPRQQHYIEQYTSMKSPYSALCDPLMSDSLRNDKNIVLVNVHAAGTPLSIVESNYLEPLYAYTYPSFTINRSYFPGENYIAFDINYYAQVAPAIIPGIIRQLVGEANLNPAFASIDIAPEYNAETRTLTVDVSGDVSADAAAIMGDLALTVVLTEDKVVAAQSVNNVLTGRTVTNKNYVHPQVLRAYMTNALGDKLTVKDNRYSERLNIMLDNSWVPSEMKVVAFISRAAETVTDANVMDMDITNANSVMLNSLSTVGISSVNTATENHKTYYALDGSVLTSSNLRHGIYIVKDANGRVYKQIVK